MKRSLLATLLLGLVSAAIVIALQLSGAMLRWEFAISAFLSRQSSMTKVVSEPWQYALIAGVSLAMTWALIDIDRWPRRWLVVALLALQLVTAAWVLALYHIFFQPLPGLLAVLLSSIAAFFYRRTNGGRRSQIVRELFGQRLSRQKFQALVNGDSPLEFAGQTMHASVVVCDIANQDDLAAELPGGNYAGVMDSFIQCAAELFLQEGAYLDAGDGEGVRAIFGLPIPDAQHAVRASAAALKLLQKLEQWKRQDEPCFGKIDARVGISSGPLIASSVASRRKGGFLVTGESLELARRFCMANRTYGSRILAGPKTFELASKSVIGRPLDFLSGRESRERFEVYEILSLVSDAEPEALARRDSFWKGVVFYRTQRYNEAFAEFEKARGSGSSDDPALQWYLRKMDALRLRLPARQENAWVGEPLPPL